MEGQEQAVPDADQDCRTDERDAGAGAARGDGEEHRAHDQREQVGPHDVRALRRIEAQAVPDRGIGAEVGDERALSAEQADADEERGRLHRPHLGAPEHADVDRRVALAQLVPDEERAQGQADREQCADDDRARARGEADEREGAGEEQQRTGEDDEAAQIEVPCAARTLGLRDAQPDGDADEGDDDGGDRERELQIAAARGEEAAGGEGAEDAAEMQADDDETRGAARLRDSALLPPTAVEDQRDLEGEPHHVEALEGPRDEEGREGVGEHQRPARHRGGDRREQQDALVPEHVAELGEHGEDQGREQQLRGLEPVDVGVAYAQVRDDLGEQGDVETLQDATGQLHENEPADETRGRPERGGAHSSDRAGDARHGARVTSSIVSSMSSSIPAEGSPLQRGGRSGTVGGAFPYRRATFTRKRGKMSAPTCREGRLRSLVVRDDRSHRSAAWGGA
ncbi:hypothetical protein QE418_002507 [Microbacterium testaceum]|nr:hypothetical protein [Microbacterium testaceum]